MAGILIVNGSFGSGKTKVAGALNDSLKPLYPNLLIKKVSDGPHLVHQITNVAHGREGNRSSNLHYHPWVESANGGHNHIGLEESSHFPFTVIDTSVTDAMIRAYLLELFLLCKNGDQGLIIAELGTGISDGIISRIDLSTTRFLQLAREQLCWDVLKEKIIGVVTVDADWKTRLERDGRRPQVADGVSQSWGMVLAGMNITREADFEPWVQEFGPRVIHIDNNPSEFLFKQLDLTLGLINRALVERRRASKEG